MIVSYDVRAQIVLHLRPASVSSVSTHPSQRSLRTSISESIKRPDSGEAFSATLARTAMDHRSKIDFAYAMEVMRSPRLVEEGFHREFPSPAHFSGRLHPVF